MLDKFCQQFDGGLKVLHRATENRKKRDSKVLVVSQTLSQSFLVCVFFLRVTERIQYERVCM